MILYVQSTNAFDSPIVKQALKSGRYTNFELRESISKLQCSHQLPLLEKRSKRMG